MPKKKKQIVKKEKKVKKDPRIERIYEEYVEFNCPVRGRVRQKVAIKRFKTLNEQAKQLIVSSDHIDQLDASDDGLAIYSDGEELSTN